MSLLDVWTAIVTYPIPLPDIMAWDWETILKIGGLSVLALIFSATG